MTQTVTMMGLPAGDEGIAKTLNVMRALIRAGKVNLLVRNTAVSLTKALPPKAYGAEVTALFGFVRDGIRYVRDIRNVETVSTPDVLLQVGAGDCDDKVVLLLSLLEAIGHPTRIVALAFADRQFSHVIGETKVGDKWVGLDATEPVGVGWEPPGITRTMVRNV